MVGEEEVGILARGRALYLCSNIVEERGTGGEVAEGGNFPDKRDTPFPT